MRGADEAFYNEIEEFCQTLQSTVLENLGLENSVLVNWFTRVTNGKSKNKGMIVGMFDAHDAAVESVVEHVMDMVRQRIATGSRPIPDLRPVLLNIPKLPTIINLIREESTVDIILN